ncbi:MAG TPA: adenylate/guanylate cyclase domain-containing protein [Euzebyales bacterium]
MTTADARPSRRWTVIALLAAPMLGLALLLAVPPLDVEWQHQPSHFWLVLLVAIVDLVLGLVIGGAAEQHGDARTSLVSMVLLVSAGFLGLHALATPGVLLSAPNVGFAIATPVGLVLASVLAALSASDRLRWLGSAEARRALRLTIAVVLIVWGVASLTQSFGLDGPPEEVAPFILRAAAPVAIALYVVAAVRYLRLYRARGDSLAFAIAVAFVLLAESMVAIIFGRAWHATWWEWHLLITAAFGVVFVAARRAYRRERSVTGALQGLYLDRTLAHLDERTASGLSAFVDALEAGRSTSTVAARLRREGVSADELRALERSATQLVRVDTLLRRHVGSRLASTLVAEPDRATLGGREAEISVLFADLAGFTAFSEHRDASEVVDMLNGYWERAVPAVTEGPDGMVERFAGDAVLVVFNALGDQPDHARRAVRAAVGMRDAIAPVAAAHPDWPRFRIGVNTGPAVIGNVGTDDQRSFTVIGDAVNVAARVQSEARRGEVVISGATHAGVSDIVVSEPLGPVDVKGRAEPVSMHRVISLR